MCRALLYGGMRESQPEAEIPLQDTTAEAFTMLLKYIYTGRATLTDEKEEQAIVTFHQKLKTKSLILQTPE